MSQEKELERLVRVETKIDTLIVLLNKVDTLQIEQRDIKHEADAAYKHAEDAHKRLDEKDKESNKFKWVVYTALIIAVLGLINL